MKKIGITDTSLRDGHQSLWATRMTTDDMLPILEKIDDVGYHSLEVWGGATFDVCMRYLHEDPWERLRTIRKNIKKTRLQMLLRGQSIVGYTHYPDDIVYRFVDQAAENGIDIFRAFDALNDIRNLETSLKAIKKTGKHAQACVVYTVSPVHTMEHFVNTALRLKDMGADSICIKDMAGLLQPYVSYELVKALKEAVELPIQLHTHYIGGLAVVSCVKAAEAGVDVIDTASVPMAFGSSQPPVETIVRALQGADYDTGLDLHALFDIADHFEQIRKQKGFERGVTRISDMKVFEHQVPGGMISNLVSQLEEQKASDRLPEVLNEIPRVRKDLGYPPLVTPTSQIISVQAVLNVLSGERYKLSPGEVKDYVRGLYGNPPAPIDAEVQNKIIGDEEVITVRPADLLEPGWEKAKKEMAEISDKEEDILSYALFPQVALKFFAYRQEQQDENLPQILPADTLGGEAAKQKEIIRQSLPKVRKKPVSRGDEEMNIDELRELLLLFDQTGIAEMEIQKDSFKISLRKTAGSKTISSETPVPENKAEAAYDYAKMVEVLSPMVGTFYAAPSPDAPPYARVGERVKKGQTLCIVEAMKLMNEVKAECDGTIVEIAVENAEPIEYNQLLFLIEKD
ncbi:MAG: acetyl-CoA carboxylase biotin carboxyl carrier protein [Syntrophomonadaceae bacterium]|nr:acetyl-CoA carboxylase biotin carboxyl carrier protein [Syntrophomonadaceae bacterium]